MGMILTPELYCFTDTHPHSTTDTTATVSSSSATATATATDTSSSVVEPLKLVLVVRTDLRMSTGKVAAQCVHAALGVLDTIHTTGAKHI